MCGRCLREGGEHYDFSAKPKRRRKPQPAVMSAYVPTEADLLMEQQLVGNDQTQPPVMSAYVPTEADLLMEQQLVGNDQTQPPVMSAYVPTEADLLMEEQLVGNDQTQPAVMSAYVPTEADLLMEQGNNNQNEVPMISVPKQLNINEMETSTVDTVEETMKNSYVTPVEQTTTTDVNTGIQEPDTIINTTHDSKKTEEVPLVTEDAFLLFGNNISENNTQYNSNATDTNTTVTSEIVIQSNETVSTQTIDILNQPPYDTVTIANDTTSLSTNVISIMKENELGNIQKLVKATWQSVNTTVSCIFMQIWQVWGYNSTGSGTAQGSSSRHIS